MGVVLAAQGALRDDRKDDLFPGPVRPERITVAAGGFRMNLCRHGPRVSNRVLTPEPGTDHAAYIQSWRRIVDQPWRIMTIGMRDWHMGSEQWELV